MTCAQVTYGVSQAGLYAMAAQAAPRAMIKAELQRMLPPGSPEAEVLAGPSDQGQGPPQDRMGSLPPGFPRTQLPPWPVSQQGLSIEGGSPRQQLQERGVEAPGTAEGAAPVQQVKT